MRIFWYILTVFFGAVGALGVLSCIEQFVWGKFQGSLAMPLAIGLLFLYLAWMSLRKARRSAKRVDEG